MPRDNCLANTINGLHYLPTEAVWKKAAIPG